MSKNWCIINSQKTLRTQFSQRRNSLMIMSNDNKTND